MKRTIILLALILLAVSALSAQTAMYAVSPKDARTMAMGGAFVAMSEGYQSLYGNPAAFADSKGEFTLLSLTSWVYVKPTTANKDMVLDLVQSLSDDPENMMALVGPLDTLITKNGFGAGVSSGLGWVGKGLGLGIVGGGEAYLGGRTLLGASGTVDGQVSGVVGIGVPISIGGLRLQVGGDVHPYLRMTGEILATDILGSVMGGGEEFDPLTLPVQLGFGLAVDLGASIDFGSLLSVGLAVRDISTKQNFVEKELGVVINYLSNGSLPPGDTAQVYQPTPNITLGASLSPIPVGLRKLLDVTVTAEIQDPLRVMEEKSSLWNLFHIGAEADLLGGFLSARAGLNKGWISMGAGIDLLILELNVALFTEEMGPRPGDRPRTGVSAEVAIRL